MTVEAWLAFCLIELVFCLKPGPSTLVVLSQSVSRGVPAGLHAALGILAANAIYFALSASGLISLHSISAQAFTAIKWCGAAYIFWLGVLAIHRSFAKGEDDAGPQPVSGGRPFARGFVVQGANPNLLVYFAAVLPQFIDPARPLVPQVAILALSSFVIEFCVLWGYAGFSGRVGSAATPKLASASSAWGVAS